MLDNVEQVLGAATDVAGLLESAPGLAVIATSREPLRIRGEREYALPPLALDEALDLFMERALAVRADCAVDWDPAIAREIVERLDRLPLGIELVAARVKLLSLGAIAERLGERLTFVAGTAARPARAPPHAARRDRVELRPARARASARCSRGSPSSWAAGRSTPPRP